MRVRIATLLAAVACVILPVAMLGSAADGAAKSKQGQVAKRAAAKRAAAKCARHATARKRKACRKRLAARARIKRPAPVRAAPGGPVAPTAPAPSQSIPVAQPETPAPAAGPGPDVVTPIQVSAKEWVLNLSRGIVPTGGVLLQFVNLGEDGHDLRITDAGGTPVLHLSESAPGDVRQETVRFSPGTYSVLCTLPGHAAAGMKTRLVVR
jgi:plastocyanin